MSGGAFVWVFNGVGGTFPSGVFTDRTLAEAWIARNVLTGTLTQYELDRGAYDRAVAEGRFTPKRDDQKTAAFIGRFSDGHEHFHYESGRRGSR